MLASQAIADVRTKGCRVCGAAFLPFRSTQVVCGVKCAKRVATLDRKQTKEKLQAMKPLQHWLKQAEQAVNKYVRLRDAHLGCVSCDRPASWPGQWHASHLRSVGAASAVRFNLWNVNKSCSICNNHKSGNLAEYEPRLRARIGDEKVNWLRTQNQLVHYTRQYLARLTAVFRKKAKRLETRP